MDTPDANPTASPKPSLSLLRRIPWWVWVAFLAGIALGHWVNQT
jgi:hypothetical protein